MEEESPAATVGTAQIIPQSTSTLLLWALEMSAFESNWDAFKASASPMFRFLSVAHNFYTGGLSRRLDKRCEDGLFR